MTSLYNMFLPVTQFFVASADSFSFEMAAVVSSSGAHADADERPGKRGCFSSALFVWHGIQPTDEYREVVRYHRSASISIAAKGWVRPLRGARACVIAGRVGRGRGCGARQGLTHCRLLSTILWPSRRPRVCCNTRWRCSGPVYLSMLMPLSSGWLCSEPTRLFSGKTG